ncbi:hypothetical protein K439DRAFT_879640 [Ramaria rubella]|nr:hypothetical protein K439DRAFT_879640 [Ramaria rubella]
MMGGILACHRGFPIYTPIFTHASLIPSVFHWYIYLHPRGCSMDMHMGSNRLNVAAATGCQCANSLKTKKGETKQKFMDDLDFILSARRLPGLRWNFLNNTTKLFVED